MLSTVKTTAAIVTFALTIVAQAGGAWAVEAQEDSAILLTITWPPERAGV